MPDPTLEDAIRENAMGPKKASGDGSSMEQHDIADQIQADKYVASKAAAKAGLGMRTVKLIPGGAE